MDATAATAIRTNAIAHACQMRRTTYRRRQSGVWWWAWYAPGGDVSGLAPDPTAPDADHERPFWFPGHAATWLRQACALAGSDMHRAEWDQLVGDGIAYRPVCR